MTTIASKLPKSPRLLVSVRDLAEAKLAVEGGCDILDLKEPARGSLGMVERELAEQVASEIHEIPVSMALGELADWQSSTSIPAVPSGVTFCKIGLSQQALNSRWRQDWENFRTRVDEMSGESHRWIAVVYADCRRAAVPPPSEILEAAVNSGCEGVLFDTFSKTEGTLFDCLPLDELTRLANVIRATRLLFAIAGSLRLEHVPLIQSLQPDILGVRGAVCSGHRRTSVIEVARVQKLRQVLNQNSTKELASR